MRRGRVRAITADAAAAIRSPSALAGLPRLVLAWVAVQAATEWDRGRAVLWLAPAFASGILLQAGASRTPETWAGPLAAALSLVVAVRGRARLPLLVAGLGMLALALGFSVATFGEDAASGRAMLTSGFRGAVSGRVESVDPRLRDQRLVIGVSRFGKAPPDARPERVRVSVGKAARIEPGDHVRLVATWQPPPGPSRPGGYDAAFIAFTGGIGAFGYAASDIAVRKATDPGWGERVERLRLDLTRRIDAAAGGGPAGDISAALVTGIRGAVPTEAEDAMRNAGLTHLLSISGTHLALVAGVLFFFVRALLALSPTLALTRPIKAWAALTALAGTAFYLMLSGAEVATQRSFLMSAIVLVAVAAGRPAVTMRNVALAAVFVLAVSPATLFGPSLEMSFSAVLAIVAGFELADRPEPAAERRRASNLGWLGRFLVAMAATTLLAGLATAPFAAFHFHRLTPYALLGNVLVLPLVSFWIMPAAVLGALLVPFGLDGWAWTLMGAGVELMLAIARFVAGLPGAERYAPAFGSGALMCFAAALLSGSLFITRLRLVAIPFALLGLWLAADATQPDILIAPDGRAAAVRGADGRLTLLGVTATALTGRSWLEADGEPPDKTRRLVERCRAASCSAMLPDGRLVTLVRDEAALPQACARSILVVTALDGAGACGAGTAVVIDRGVLSITGALALYPEGDGFGYEAARPPGKDRPWYGRSQRARDAAAHFPKRFAPAGPAPAELDAPAAGDPRAGPDAALEEPDGDF